MSCSLNVKEYQYAVIFGSCHDNVKVGLADENKNNETDMK